MYDVIGTRKSRAFRVLWMLEEIGAHYSQTATMPHTEDAKSANASGKIPSLRDGDITLTDSCAILNYLADKHEKFTFPAGTANRGRQDAFLHRVLDEIDSTLWMAARHSFVLPQERRVPEIKDSLKWEYNRNLARFAKQFEGPYVMGETMTVPDFVLTHCLGWAGIAGFDAPPDALETYHKSMTGRGAYQAVLKLS